MIRLLRPLLATSHQRHHRRERHCNNNHITEPPTAPASYRTSPENSRSLGLQGPCGTTTASSPRYPARRSAPPRRRRRRAPAPRSDRTCRLIPTAISGRVCTYGWKYGQERARADKPPAGLLQLSSTSARPSVRPTDRMPSEATPFTESRRVGRVCHDGRAVLLRRRPRLSTKRPGRHPTRECGQARHGEADRRDGALGRRRSAGGTA